jgi:hypothetical protein
MGMAEMMVLICLKMEPHMTQQDVKAIAEELFPYQMGQNNNMSLRAKGESCLEQLK